MEFDSLFHKHGASYFKQKRKTLAYKLTNDIDLFSSFLQPSTSGLGKTDSSLSPKPQKIDEPAPKKIKTESKEDAIQLRLKVFVETFIKHISELLIVYHITAKGSRLSRDSLKKELKVGATGALFHSTFGPFLTINNTALNNQSLLFSWIYHTFLGRKAKPLNFKTIEIENENMIYNAIDKFERLQNQSTYS